MEAILWIISIVAVIALIIRDRQARRLKKDNYWLRDHIGKMRSQAEWDRTMTPEVRERIKNSFNAPVRVPNAAGSVVFNPDNDSTLF